ncbi:hypothetical protein SAMN05444161_5289 [Rhizobiales bacterium GAS191]|nr:hypothetical protein SAMN05444161_5289 [Rhizobiales bacterium GAS191]
MPMPEQCVVKFYREKPGDLGIEDSPIGEAQDMEVTAGKALLGYFSNPNIAPVQRPRYARVVTEDGMKVMFTLMATGPQNVERV